MPVRGSEDQARRQACCAFVLATLTNKYLANSKQHHHSLAPTTMLLLPLLASFGALMPFKMLLFATLAVLFLAAPAAAIEVAARNATIAARDWPFGPAACTNERFYCLVVEKRGFTGFKTLYGGPTHIEQDNRDKTFAFDGASLQRARQAPTDVFPALSRQHRGPGHHGLSRLAQTARSRPSRLLNGTQKRWSYGHYFRERLCWRNHERNEGLYWQADGDDQSTLWRRLYPRVFLRPSRLCFPFADALDLY